MALTLLIFVAMIEIPEPQYCPSENWAQSSLLYALPRVVMNEKQKSACSRAFKKNKK